MRNGKIIGKINLSNVKNSTGLWSVNDVKDKIEKDRWQAHITASGGYILYSGEYKIHVFYNSGTFTVSSGQGNLEYLVVGGGGGGGMDMAGGGGGGGVLKGDSYFVKAGDSIPVVVGAGGKGAPPGAMDGQAAAHQFTVSATNGGYSGFGNLTVLGGGYGGSSYYGYSPNNGNPGYGATTGGPSGYSDGNTRIPGQGTYGQGFSGGRAGGQYYSGGGGGAGGPGTSSTAIPHGGVGIYSDILGFGAYFGGGGGGAGYSQAPGGNGGAGGGGAGALGTSYGGVGWKWNNGQNCYHGGVSSWAQRPGGDAGNHTGGGGGGGSHYNRNNRGGQGGSGIVVVRYKIPASMKPTVQNYGSYYGYSDGTYAQSAWEYKLNGATADGVYRINLPTVGATDIYCLMGDQYDGGGWMMAMKATRGTTFNYSSSYWTTANTLNPTALNRNDGDAKFNSFNYYQGNDLLALWPDIGAGGSIGGLGMWSWLQKSYPARFQLNTATPLYLFQNASRYMIDDALLFSGWGNGVFSTQTDVRFYGFNWTDNMNCRWGFGWNENGGGLHPDGALGSDDVSGGIGMSQGSYSAGDIIACCQNRTGINRSARVEVYVR